MIYPELLRIVLSVDSNEWYYGRPENRKDPDKRILVTGLVSENAIVSIQYAKEINDYFLWTSERERDTAKRKKRPLYVDRGFFINEDFSFDA